MLRKGSGFSAEDRNPEGVNMPTTEPLLAGIVPFGLYTLPAFYQLTGISETRRRLARRGGVELDLIEVGRRKLVKGDAAISYVEALAELSEAEGQR